MLVIVTYCMYWPHQEKDVFIHSPSNLEQLTDKRRRERDVVHQVCRSMLTPTSLCFSSVCSFFPLVKIHQNEKQASDHGLKQEPYLLSNDWLHRWQRFTQSDTLGVFGWG